MKQILVGFSGLLALVVIALLINVLVTDRSAPADIVSVSSAIAPEDEATAPETPPEYPAVDEPAAVEGSDYQARLTSTTWVWQETVMSNDDRTVPQQAGAFTLTFSPDGRVNGATDCNGFMGSYTLDEATLELGPLAATMMYCEGSQEQVFTSAVSEANTVYFDDAGNLVLLYPYDSGSVIFAPAGE